jgi:hypothetical protein
MKVLLVGVLFVQLSLIAAAPVCDTVTHDHEGEYECEDGWTKFGLNCYKKEEDMQKWAAAEAHCVEHGGHLVSILSEKENEFVKGLGTDVWLGLSDKGTEGTFVWTDGSPATSYTNWAAGQPDDWQVTGGEDCTHNLAAGTWNDLACDGTRKSICKKKATKKCKTGFALFKQTGDCYRLMEVAKPWYEAEHDCAEQGAHLVSIQSLEENKHVISLKADQYLWIGLTDKGKEGTFSWTDGSALVFTHWATGQPDNWQTVGGEDCVHTLKPDRDGGWNDNKCTTKMMYVCKH